MSDPLPAPQDPEKRLWKMEASESAADRILSFSNASDSASGDVIKMVFVRENGNSEEKPYPEHMYVAAPVVAKSVSVFAAAIFAISLLFTFSDGFSLVDPFAAIIGLVAAATFYAMGALATRQAKHDRTRDRSSTR